MKRTNILFFIAAAALISSLCGMFFYNTAAPASSAAYASNSTVNTDFSIDTARDSLELCSSSYNEDELAQKLAERNYENFRYFEKKQETNYSNGIAFGIAKSKIQDKDYVCLVIRGTSAKEWYSNFQIGETQEHAGFSAAADFVMKSVDTYLDEQKTDKSNTIVFLTGHSRGAAVANLCAKRMTDSKEYTAVSAYTFACPNTTTALDAKDKQYACIYNIVNPEDFICCIPLASWGYTKYGTDITLPQKGCDSYYDLYDNMEDRFFEVAQRKHTGYPDGDRDVERFIAVLEKISPTIKDYYNKEITLFPHRVTMYEYMQSAAALLSGDRTLSNGMILLSGSTSPVLSAVTDFITQGISIEEMAEDTDLMSSAIGSAHSCETYTAWLQVLNDEYFENLTG